MTGQAPLEALTLKTLGLLAIQFGMKLHCKAHTRQLFNVGLALALKLHTRACDITLDNPFCSDRKAL